MALACSPPSDERLARNVAPIAAHEETAPEEPKDPSQLLAQAQVTTKGMDLYMHDLSPTDGEDRLPTLWLHAEEGTLNEDQSWGLLDANAIFYRGQEEDVIMKSRHGRYDQASNLATLQGGVEVRAGSLTLETEAIDWNNDEGLARSRAAVQMTDGATVLNAEEMTLQPREGEIVLYNVAGNLQLDQFDAATLP